MKIPRACRLGLAILILLLVNFGRESLAAAPVRGGSETAISYQIQELTLRYRDGSSQSNALVATAGIKKLPAAKAAQLMIASYDSNGKQLDIIARDLPAFNDSTTVTVDIPNASGRVDSIGAFILPVSGGAAPLANNASCHITVAPKAEDVNTSVTQGHPSESLSEAMNQTYDGVTRIEFDHVPCYRRMTRSRSFDIVPFDQGTIRDILQLAPEQESKVDVRLEENVVVIIFRGIKIGDKIQFASNVCDPGGHTGATPITLKMTIPLDFTKPQLPSFEIEMEKPKVIPPAFAIGSPVIYPSETSARLSIQLDCPGTHYAYMVAPLGTVRTQLEDVSDFGGVLDPSNTDNHNWKKIPLGGNAPAQYAAIPSAASILNFPSSPGSGIISGNGIFHSAPLSLSLTNLKSKTQYIVYLVLRGEEPESISKVYLYRFETADVQTPAIWLSPAASGVQFSSTAAAQADWILLPMKAAQMDSLLGQTLSGDRVPAEYRDMTILSALRAEMSPSDARSVFDAFATPAQKSALLNYVCTATPPGITDSGSLTAEQADTPAVVNPANMVAGNSYTFITAARNALTGADGAHGFKAISDIVVGEGASANDRLVYFTDSVAKKYQENGKELYQYGGIMGGEQTNLLCEVSKDIEGRPILEGKAYLASFNKTGHITRVARREDNWFTANTANNRVNQYVQATSDTGGFPLDGDLYLDGETLYITSASNGHYVALDSNTAFFVKQTDPPTTTAGYERCTDAASALAFLGPNTTFTGSLVVFCDPNTGFAKTVIIRDHVFERPVFVVGYESGSSMLAHALDKALIITMDQNAPAMKVVSITDNQMSTSEHEQLFGIGNDTPNMAAVNKWVSVHEIDGVYYVDECLDNQFHDNSISQQGKELVDSAHAVLGQGDQVKYGNSRSIYVTVDADYSIDPGGSITYVNSSVQGIKNAHIRAYTQEASASHPFLPGKTQNTQGAYVLYNEHRYIDYAIIIGEEQPVAEEFVYICSDIVQKCQESEGHLYRYHGIVNGETTELITKMSQDTFGNSLREGVLYLASYNVEGHIIKMVSQEDNWPVANTANNKINQYVQATSGVGNLSVKTDLHLEGDTLFITDASNNHYLALNSDTAFFVKQTDPAATTAGYVQCASATSALALLGSDTAFTGSLVAVCDPVTGFAGTVIICDRVYNPTAPQPVFLIGYESGSSMLAYALDKALIITMDQNAPAMKVVSITDNQMTTAEHEQLFGLNNSNPNMAAVNKWVSVYELDDIYYLDECLDNQFHDSFIAQPGNELIDATHVTLGQGEETKFGNDKSIYVTVDADYSIDSDGSIRHVNSLVQGIKNAHLMAYTREATKELGFYSPGKTKNAQGAYVLHEGGYVKYAIVVGEECTAAESLAYLTGDMTKKYLENGKYLYSYPGILNGEAADLISATSVDDYGSPLIKDTLYHVHFNHAGHIFKLYPLPDNWSTANTANNKVNQYVRATSGVGNLPVNADLHLEGDTLFITETSNSHYVVLDRNTTFFVKQTDPAVTADGYGQYANAADALALLGPDATFTGNFTAICDPNTGLAKIVLIWDNAFNPPALQPVFLIGYESGSSFLAHAKDNAMTIMFEQNLPVVKFIDIMDDQMTAAEHEQLFGIGNDTPNMTAVNKWASVHEVDGIYYLDECLDQQFVDSKTQRIDSSHVILEQGNTVVYGNAGSVYAAVDATTAVSATGSIVGINSAYVGIKNTGISVYPSDRIATETVPGYTTDAHGVYVLYEGDFVKYAIAVGEGDFSRDSLVYLTDQMSHKYLENNKYLYGYPGIKNGVATELIAETSQDALGNSLLEGVLYLASYNGEGHITKLIPREDNWTTAKTQTNKERQYIQATSGGDGSPLGLRIEGNVLWIGGGNSYVVLSDEVNFFVKQTDPAGATGGYEEVVDVSYAFAMLGSTSAFTGNLAVICDPVTGFATTVIIQDSVYEAAATS